MTLPATLPRVIFIGYDVAIIYKTMARVEKAKSRREKDEKSSAEKGPIGFVDSNFLLVGLYHYYSRTQKGFYRSIRIDVHRLKYSLGDSDLGNNKIIRLLSRQTNIYIYIYIS